jgi:hypothetical protein
MMDKQPRVSTTDNPLVFALARWEWRRSRTLPTTEAKMLTVSSNSYRSVRT